jgi:hypothetical protein
MTPQIDNRLKSCTWNGELFESVTACARFNKVTVAMQIRRFNLGYKSDEDMQHNQAKLRAQKYFTRDGIREWK